MTPEPVEGNAVSDGVWKWASERGRSLGARWQMLDVDDAAVIGQLVQKHLEGGLRYQRHRASVGPGGDESQWRNYERVAETGCRDAQRSCGGSLTLSGVLLSVGVSHSGSWTILSVRGEIDMATCPQLRQEIVAQISAGHTHLVIDLGGVKFIDSTGLGVLIGGLKRTRSQGGDLRVSRVGERLEKMFELTGLGDVLAVVELSDPEQALGAA